MSGPVGIPVSGPPPSRAVAKSRLIAPSWGPPTSLPVDLPPPAVKKAYAGVVVTRSAYTCLPREGNDRLTACGRLLFLDAIAVSENPGDVTCMFCRMRLDA